MTATNRTLQVNFQDNLTQSRVKVDETNKSDLRRECDFSGLWGGLNEMTQLHVKHSTQYNLTHVNVAQHIVR